LDARSLSRPIKWAIALGAAPLVTGVTVYLLWRITRWPWLELAGLATIAVGCLAVLAGVVLLLLHIHRQARVVMEPQRALRIRVALAGALLLANFPTAVALAWSAADVMSTYTLRIDNAGPDTINSLVVHAPGVVEEMGPIPPNGRAIAHLRFNADGSVTFLLRQQNRRIEGVIDSYVTGGIGDDVTLGIHPDGAYEVRSNLPPTKAWTQPRSHPPARRSPK
jgi:hypothetical protein